MPNEDLIAQLKELARFWNEVEARIKDAEDLLGEPVVASLNELRYAGRRLVDLIYLVFSDEPADQDEFRSILYEAKQNCIRARHDAIDSLYFEAREYFKSTEKTFNVAIVCKIHPGYLETQRVMREAGKVISQSREERARRPELYETIWTTWLPQIMETYHALRTSEQRLVEELALAQSEARKKDETIETLQQLLNAQKETREAQGQTHAALVEANRVSEEGRLKAEKKNGRYFWITLLVGLAGLYFALNPLSSNSPVANPAKGGTTNNQNAPPTQQRN